MAELTIELSKKSIQETIKKLESIKNRTNENLRLATADLMNSTYDMLCQLLEENNLSNHISSLKAELTDDGLGFRIYTNDMIIIFHEYGTGIFNSNGNGTPQWTYYSEKYTNEKGTHFFTTSGMPAKHIFYDVEQFLAENAKEYYNVAVEKTLTDEQYQSFKSSLR